MKKCSNVGVGIAVLALLASTVQTQGSHERRFKLFGGYSNHSHYLANHGWNASITMNVNEWVGIVTDASGHYREVPPDFAGFARFPGFAGVADVHRNIHNLLVGPQVWIGQLKSFRPFGRAMIGISGSSTERLLWTRLEEGRPVDPIWIDTESTDFTLGLGGGVDWKVSDSLSVRIIQFDRLRHLRAGRDFRFNRFSAGVVIDF